MISRGNKSARDRDVKVIYAYVYYFLETSCNQLVERCSERESLSQAMCCP